MAVLSAAVAQDADPRMAAESALGSFIRDGDDLQYPFIGMSPEAHCIVIPEGASGFLGFGVGASSAKESDVRVTSTPVVTADQVHFIVQSMERDKTLEDGTTDRAYFVVTRRDGEWAVQFIAALGDPASNQASVEAAKSTIDRFFVAWNAGDNSAIHKETNFPHAFLTREGRASIANTPEELITDFDGMRDREGWAHSEYRDFEVVHADDAKVIARLTFTRHHADGAIYRTVPVIWIITNLDGHWGLQIRLILPALEGD